MLILLSGPDDYRREAEKKRYVEAFTNKYPEAIRAQFDFSDEKPAEIKKSIGELAQFLGNQSLFAKIKLAILENISGDATKGVAEVIKDAVPRKDVVLVMSERKAVAEPIKRIVKKYSGEEKVVTVKEFDYLEGREWQAFVKTIAGKEGVVLEADAFDYFVTRYQKDTWGLVTELRKVSTLGGKTLARKDVESLDVALAPAFFGLLGGLKSQRLVDRLTALERVFAGGGAPAKVFNMLAYSGPGYIQRFAEYDVMFKSGKMEYAEILLDAVL